VVGRLAARRDARRACPSARLSGPPGAVPDGDIDSRILQRLRVVAVGGNPLSASRPWQLNLRAKQFFDGEEVQGALDCMARCCNNPAGSSLRLTT
jgi:hypothetical protein